jgi:hypothetical protein
LTIALAVVAIAGFTGVARAQVQTGEILGKVTDKTGAVLPGVAVTISSQGLLQPQTAVTSTTGTYVFTRIPIGTYQVKFELTGFKTQVFEDIRVTIGFRAQVNGELEVSAVQETITVTGESPVVDTKETGTQTTFSQELLQNIPSARDPWVMLERTPAITMDRVNVGGSQSGQQSGYVSRGTGSGNNKWSIDGVDITDMSATGASPIYYDFDMMEEMQVTTGGADAAQQTGGVGINMVTRSGSDTLRGSGRLYITDDKFEAVNVTDEVRRAGAGSGAPIQNIKDYGFEVGGPIKRGKLWYWGSYGKQDIKAGIVGFYLPSAECQAMKAALAADPLAFAVKDVWSCLGTDGTLLNNYNWKLQWAPFQDNKFSFQNTWAAKTKNARDASDTRPIETTYRQKAVSSDFGRAGWTTGPSPLWKASDQHILSDRWLLEVQWAHLGNNFTLDFHEDSLSTVQPRQETTTGVYARSYQQSVFLRPTQSVDVTSNYFLPGMLGGDHQFKVGYRWRIAWGESINHYGGNALARYTNSLPNSADLYRDGHTAYDLGTNAFYAQDTYTIKKLTLNLGFRWDRQRDDAAPTSVPANPIIPQIMPAIDFPGADSGVVWNNVSPRLGVTYDLAGNGHTIAKASYATYYGQMGPGSLAGELIAVGQVFVRYPWNDANGDGFVQANELDTTRVLTRSSSFNPANPGNYNSPGKVDPNIKNDRAREFIVGVDHELFRGVAVGASYIWRKYDQFNWRDLDNWTTANYRQVTYTPTCTVADARCETVTYFEPTSQVPAPFTTTNIPDRFRDYNGVELTARRRYANRWAANFSVAYNNAIDHWDSVNAYEDPTNIVNQNGAQYAPESSGSGIDNIFTNAKWLVKVNGLYTLPWYDIGVSGNLNLRQGYPFPQSVQSPNRANGGGQAQVLLDPLGDVRLPNVYTLDLRVDKAFTVARNLRVAPSMDVFNLTNVNTILARRRNQAAGNANLISGIVAPRVIRFGFRVTW